MAPGQKLYPRSTVKKIVKAQSKCNVSKNADVMIFLDYVLFMQTLVKEAAIDSKQAGERGISAKSVKKVTAVGPIHKACPLFTTSPAAEAVRVGHTRQVQRLRTIFSVSCSYTCHAPMSTEALKRMGYRGTLCGSKVPCATWKMQHRSDRHQ
ncbi:uncharacterized protein BCR38DRAFT_524244 [Pseudomassariella vexata]|uniref:Transcription factor CBF/NF-Y/archaeal histone domain-containing protein n=1 Tax=Pseudomassariella vexata TaxID=1141098 RepID=A0A1Y2DZS9_9PEZI|nr:uncharacterized protein BCR38DRAFT_524244 [Pseudomassariella vexata]ORY64135.1 hypothetical protein BCR38DRAFT_524244 [Pseudomassariella vexata]